ncbi:MAG: ATP-binding cassette domain-containing protein [Vicinamibacterales bacterium]
MIAFDSVSIARGGRRVLERFTLTVEPGETVALVGASGEGKTTVLRLVNRMLEPDDGRVMVEGRETREWDPIVLRRRCGYVLQEIALFPHMTVGGNVALVPRLDDRPFGDREVAALLELVGLEPERFAAKWPSELSGGQRQRAGVARALAADPPVLLMDEPFGALDPVTRAELHAELRRIQSRVRKTILLVTHDIGEAFALADRVGVLADGALAACDSPAAIARSHDPRVRRLLDAMPRL